MGFYLRKSISFGPLRFNLSKSGVGVSAGVRGLRIGTGPRGNYVHLGRGGLYYRTTLPARSLAPSAPGVAQVPAIDGLSEIDSGSVSNMVDASSADLLNEINTKCQRWRLWPWLVTIALAVVILVANASAEDSTSASVLVVTLIAAAILATWFAYRRDVAAKTTVLLYELDGEAAARFQQVHDTFEQLAKCAGRWHVDARGQTADRRRNADAGETVRRHRIALVTSSPPFLQTNIAVPSIPVGRQTLYLFPDRLLVVAPDGVGAVPYHALTMETTQRRLIETDLVPSDATLVGKTWTYTNKDGGPDRRFKNNREIPIVLYQELHFQSSTGLNEVLQFSRAGVVEPFIEAVKNLAHAG